VCADRALLFITEDNPHGDQLTRLSLQDSAEGNRTNG
jgi:hypothetical protein